MEEVIKDERFSHIFTDPRFRKIPKNVRKIKVDNRFKGMFKSKQYNEKCRVDERGRSLNLEPSENLKKLYNLDDDSSDESDEESLESKRAASELNHPKNEKAKLKKNIELHLETNKKGKGKQHMKGNKDDLNDRTPVSKIQTQKKDAKNSSKYLKSENVKETSDLSEEEDGKSMYLKKKVNKSKDKFKIQESSHKNLKGAKRESFEPGTSTEISHKNKNLKQNKNIKAEVDSRFIQENLPEEESSSEESDEEDSSFGNENKQESDSDSSSNSEESESEDSSSTKGDVFDHEWEEQHQKAPDTEEITRRLAVCNMDWDRIRAVDLFTVFNSFKPPDTIISSVKIYPSEYGLKRMEEEKLKGPPELVEKTLGSDEEEAEEDVKGGKYHREKLRQYQMNRLKYYFAVVECDTSKTANTLYEQLNGMEYESSSVRFDLRFIPEDMTFDQEPISVADSVPDLAEYKPRVFVTTALQQVKVGLTWDETDPQRRETLQKAFTEPDNIEKDIKEYLASSSGESEDEVEDEAEGGVKLSTKERIQKYKALLESLNEQEKEKNQEKYEMEITWEPGVKEKTENLVKEKLEEKTFTPFEELQKKKKEKQKLKKKEKKIKNQEEKLENSVSEDSDSSAPEEERTKKNEKRDSKGKDELYLISDSRKVDEAHSQKSKKKKKKIVQENSDDFKVDVNDPRFSAIYTSPLFNIDPSDPHFKSTPGNLAIIAEKQRRLKNKSTSNAEYTKSKKSRYN